MQFGDVVWMHEPCQPHIHTLAPDGAAYRCDIADRRNYIQGLLDHPEPEIMGTSCVPIKLADEQQVKPFPALVDIPEPTNAIESLMQTYRRRCIGKRRARRFTLTYEQFSTLIYMPCHYCGGVPSSKFVFRSEVLIFNGIDRQNNHVGYEPDNCVPCCFKCNLAKAQMTVADFESHMLKIAAFIKARNTNHVR